MNNTNRWDEELEPGSLIHWLHPTIKCFGLILSMNQQRGVATVLTHRGHLFTSDIVDLKILDDLSLNYWDLWEIRKPPSLYAVPYDE